MKSIMVGKGIKDVARALRSHEKEAQVSLGTNHNALESKLWKVNTLLKALEILAENRDNVSKPIKSDVLSE